MYKAKIDAQTVPAEKNKLQNRKNSFREKSYIFLSRLGIATFQKIFPDYFAQEPLSPTDRYIEYPFAIRNLPKPPAKILDVGCAGSPFPLLLAGFGYFVYGIDLREYAITNRITFDNFQFIKGDITKTAFSDNFFDAVTAISTVEHIGIGGRYGVSDDLQGDKKALEEIRRILKPQGILILTIPFGKAKIIKPYCKIYDSILIKQLTQNFKLEKEEYCMQDSGNDWHGCLKDEAEKIDAKNDRFALCLLKLVKK